MNILFFFFSSRRRHTRLTCDWSSDVCSSDLEKVGVGKEQSEWQNAENGDPYDVFAADFVAHGTADNGAGGDGAEKNKKVELSALKRHVKVAHQIERVIAHQAGQVEKLRK